MDKSNDLFKQLEEVIRNKKFESITGDLSDGLKDIFNLNDYLKLLYDFFSLKNVDVENFYKFFDMIFLKQSEVINIGEENINFIYLKENENNVSIMVFFDNNKKDVININFSDLKNVKLYFDNKYLIVDLSNLIQQYLFEKIINNINLNDDFSVLVINLMNLFSYGGFKDFGVEFINGNEIRGFVYVFNEKIEFYIDKDSRVLKVGDFEMSI